MSNNNTHLPLVSVVTPSLNDAEFIERTIQSVANQDYPNLEHIVVDGGSTDGTMEILKRYPKVRWISEKDSGQSDALNKGFKLARGEIVGWLNSDDTYNPGAIRSAVDCLEAHPSTAMVYSHCNIIDADDRIISTLYAPLFDLARELIDHILPQPTIFLRATALAEVGYLDSRLHYIMDWEFFLRLGLKARIDRVDKVWANFRQADGTKTMSNPERFWVEALSVFDEFFARADLPAGVRAVRNQAYARAAWMAGLHYCAKADLKAMGLGNAYYRQSVSAYPILEKDFGFVRASLIDVALRWAPTQPYVFIEKVLGQLALSRKTRRVILGHLYASRALMKPETRPRERWEWLRQAISYDARWLCNRGIRALLWRDTIRTIESQKS